MENVNEQKQGFDFKRFINDSKLALLKPQEYFATMPTTGGFGEPTIKVVIYGVIIGLFAFLWSLLHLRYVTGPSWLGGSMGIMAFFGSIIGAIVGLFIGGLIMLVISSILNGKNDYEANVRVIAALMVIRIFSSFFSFFDGINLYLSAIISIALSLWGLYMTYHALVGTLKAKEKGSKILMIIFTIIIIIVSIAGIATKKLIKNITGKYNIENINKMSENEQQNAALNMLEKVTGGELKSDDMKKTIEETQKVINNVFTIEMANGTTNLNPDEDLM